VKRLIAVALLLSGCADANAYPTAAPALMDPVSVEQGMVSMAPVRKAAPAGVITFGTALDPETLEIPKPLTRFKRTYPLIAWSADLSRGVDAAFVSWVVVRQSESGSEEIVIDVEWPIDDLSDTHLSTTGALAFHVDNVAGTYVMRYMDSLEVLAEGTFTLVK
jgi:hypothetical protein